MPADTQDLNALLAEAIKAVSDEVVTMRPMTFDDGRKGWYIDHPEFYCDLEPNPDTGKWSVFFKDKNGFEGYGEYDIWQDDEDDEDELDHAMNNRQMHLVAGVFLCFLSLVGLSGHVDYSGWLMFIGILLLIN